MIGLSPGHHQQRNVITDQATASEAVRADLSLVGQPIRFSVVNGVPHFIFMTGDHHFRIKTPDGTHDIRGPAIGQQDVDPMMATDRVNPGEIAAVRLITHLAEGHAFGRKDQWDIVFYVGSLVSGIVDDPQFTPAVLDGQDLNRLRLPLQMGYVGVDRPVLPDFGGSNDGFLLFKKRLRHPFIGVIPMPMADKESIALFDESFHQFVGKCEFLGPPQAGTHQVKAESDRGCANNETMIIELPDHGAVLDMDIFDLLNGSTDTIMEKRLDRQAFRCVHIVQDAVEYVCWNSS